MRCDEMGRANLVGRGAVQVGIVYNRAPHRLGMLAGTRRRGKLPPTQMPQVANLRSTLAGSFACLRWTIVTG